MHIRRGIPAAALALLILAPGSARAASVTVNETFENGTNEGAWTFGTGNEILVLTNGNPGAYLRDQTLVTFQPKASTSFGVPSAFTGDYRASGVTSVGIDLAVAAVDGNISGRTLSLILLNDNGTPDDLGDDWGAYTVTNLPVPPPGVIGLAPGDDLLQWRSYDLPVPSQDGRLPQGWTWISSNMVRNGGSWARLMRDVDHVGFLLADPAVLYPLFRWDVALDNPRITRLQ